MVPSTFKSPPSRLSFSMCSSSPRTMRVPRLVSMTMVFSSKLSTSSTPETESCSRSSRMM